MADLKNEVINEAIKTAKALVMELAYGDGEDDDFDAIVALNDIFKVITDEAASIEQDRDRQKRLATRMRLQIGKELSDLCDKAGLD